MSPTGAMVCMQPRAESFSLAFSELPIYKIANLCLRSSRLPLDSILLETAKGERRFAFPVGSGGLGHDADECTHVPAALCP